MARARRHGRLSATARSSARPSRSRRSAELAEESAGGGKLEELRQQLVALRVTEAPEGIEEAEEAALALEQTIRAAPRLASPVYLDAVGLAARGSSRRSASMALAVRRGDEARAPRVVTSSSRRCWPGIKRRAYVSWTRWKEGGFNFPFGGDPEDLMRGLREFAEQQAESVAEAQREQFATLTLNTAVELTAAALGQVDAKGGPTSRRSPCATRCASCSPRRSRSSARRARGSCANRASQRSRRAGSPPAELGRSGGPRLALLLRRRRQLDELHEGRSLLTNAVTTSAACLRSK